MPTYEYACEACGHELEIFHGINEAPRRKCPRCGKLRLQRRIGAGAGFVFKGSGFYQTDYRSDSYKQAEKTEREGASGKEPAERKPSEAKPTEAPAKEPATQAPETPPAATRKARKKPDKG